VLRYSVNQIAWFTVVAEVNNCWMETRLYETSPAEQRG
jgi:hypothetical protein